MLEKIGLPAKPSMRGGSWVVDASHCQGCSSQFTFINRKHHCRRCGGLFCNSCTQQRMLLRGQGDAAVRICDPCKKLEDAARFELRHGHRSRAGKGSLRLEPKNEQEVDQIAGAEGKQCLAIRELQSVDSDLQRVTSDASSSNFHIESVAPEGKDAAIPNNTPKDSRSPEELRQQAAEEKKKHRILKAEGKPEEALQAFKRGKELERQAAALEIALRKSRRMASAVNNSASSERNYDGHDGTAGERNTGSQSVRVPKDDLLSELKDLGWSNADLHETEKKPENLSLEGELSRMIKDIPSKSSTARGSNGIDNSQVLAHKRNALLLKREGKLSEAKEELKKAKILEKQLEEQELLGQDNDSDDELSALIRSMDDSKQTNELMDRGHVLNVNFDVSGLNDLAFDDNFDVTADDMNDPEIAAALRSFGWNEEDDNREEESTQPVLRNREALESEVLSLKREALKYKRAGNTSEAIALLKKAKLLEKDLENTHDLAALQKESNQQKSVSSIPDADENNILEMRGTDHRPKPKSKLLIQRELLALKKRVLALRREGHTDEADEELRKGKELELQLQEMENAPNVSSAVAQGNKKKSEVASSHQGISVDMGFDIEENADVTEEDMSDPALLSVLKKFGWDDETEPAITARESGSSKQANGHSPQEFNPPVVIAKAPRSKAEIQRELLGIKRKALALRRQGKTQEADGELEKAKFLEKQMDEMEVQYLPTDSLPEMKTDVSSDQISVEKPKIKASADVSAGLNPSSSSRNKISDNVMNTAESYVVASQNVCATSMPSTLSKLDPSVKAQENEVMVEPCTTSHQAGISLDNEHLPTGDDRKMTDATSMKQKNRENGSQNDGLNERDSPKLLSNNSGSSKLKVDESPGSSNTVDVKQTVGTATEQVPLNETDTSVFDSVSGQILARKRKAIALKREGRLAEAREELRQAKILEKSLELDQHEVNEARENINLASGQHEVSGTSENISLSLTTSSSSGGSGKHKKPVSSRDRFKLQQESLTHKRQALKLRREGRIEESEAELELAKALETQLEELDNQSSGNKKGLSDDPAVEDLLDPQLLSALRSIGWAESDINIMQAQEKPQPKSVAKSMGASPPGKSEAVSSVTPGGSNTSSPEKATLEEQIKAEKVRALNLKRAGKQAEALEALRSAKRLEKRLISLS